MELSRPSALDHIGPATSEVTVEATPEELKAVAARLRVVAVHKLRCDYRLRRIGGTAIEAAGRLRASVTETCVVSLDHFAHKVAEDFVIHFVPAGTEDEDPEPDTPDQIPFEGAVIDLGEAAVEQLALALDPYPRKPGAALPDDAATEAPGPFSALSRLRETE